MDGIELEIVWSNLISIVSEQAKAMQRIAFSPIVREAGDLANALFDRRGRMVAQAVTGTPGHINSLAAAGKHFVEAFPTQTLEEGDVLITGIEGVRAGANQNKNAPGFPGQQNNQFKGGRGGLPF